MIKDLIYKSRSYRRFYQDVPIELETLKELPLVPTGSPSSTSCPVTLKPTLRYLKTWHGPVTSRTGQALKRVKGPAPISSSWETRMWHHSSLWTTA